MTHRAVLKTEERDFPLNQNLTTIGHGSCDIVTDSKNTAALHAIIEFSQDNNCYLLRDLSTEQGTYVNERRIQAGCPARLAHGDRLRLGASQQTLQLAVEWPAAAATKASSSSSVASSSMFRSRPPPPQTQTPTSSTLPTVRLGRPTSAGAQLASSSSSSARRNDGAAAAAAAAGAEQRLTAVQFELHCLHTEAAKRDRQLEDLRQRLAESQRDSQNRLGALETEVAARDARLAELQDQLGRGPAQAELKELEKLRKDAGIAGGLLAQMQKDMSGKDATISRLAREIESLKETVKARDQKIHSLVTKSPADAKAEAEARQARERELAGLRARLRDSEVRAEARDAAARDLRSGLDAAHVEAEREAATARRLAEELETARAQAVDRERSERLVRVDLQQANSRLERLRSRLMSIAFGMPDAPKPEGLATDDQLLEAVAGAVEERAGLRAEGDRLRAALEAAGRARSIGASAATACCERLSETFGRLAERGRSVAALEDEIALMAAAEAASEAAAATPEEVALAAEAAPLKPLTASVLEDLRQQLRWQRDTEDALETCGASVRLSDASPAQHLAQLRERWSDTAGQLERARARLAELEARAAGDADSLTERLNADWQARLADELEAAAWEARRERAAAVSAAVEEEAQRWREAAEREAAAHREAVSQLEAALKRRADEEAARGAGVKAELEVARRREAELREQLAGAEASGAEAKASARASGERRAAGERELREQLRQASGENRRLEEALEEAGRRAARLQSELEAARADAEAQLARMRRQVEEEVRQRRVTEEASPRRLSGAAASVKVAAPPPMPPPPRPPPTTAQADKENDSDDQKEQKLEALSKENSGLRQEVARLATRLAESEAKQQQQQQQLRERQSDRWPQQQKQQQQPQPAAPKASELEASRRRQRAAEAEASAAASRAEKLAELTERQRARLQEATEKLERQRAVIKKLKSALEERDAEAKELRRRLREAEQKEEEKKRKKQERDEGGTATGEEEGEASNGAMEAELAALGHQCRGERHSQVIQHQREALRELRARLKDAELGVPAKSSPDQMAQQVTLLKREVAQLRSRQALAETGRLSGGAAAAAPATSDLDRELGSTGLARIATVNAELQTERATNSQAAECLETSEQAYLTLARALTSALQVTAPLPGQAPMALALAPAQRHQLAEAREQAMGLLCQRARQLCERAERKDRLLEGYDGDMARLRQALQLAEARSAQVDSLAEQLRERAEEAELLRASLREAKAAAKGGSGGGGGGGGGGGCTVIRRAAGGERQGGGGRDGDSRRERTRDESEETDKDATRKRAIRERMKRKDYEISALKAELRSREKDLRNASTKLSGLQTTLGLPHESELRASGEASGAA